jgi:hypothetical protein
MPAAARPPESNAPAMTRPKVRGAFIAKTLSFAIAVGYGDPCAEFWRALAATDPNTRRRRPGSTRRRCSARLGYDAARSMIFWIFVVVWAAFTLYCAISTLPFSSTTNVERMTPCTVLPYIDFSP